MSTGPQPEPEAPWPVLVRLRRWHSPRRTGRLIGLTAMTVLVLLTTTAAAAPPRPLFTSQLTLPAVVSFDHDQQHLYVVEAPEPARVVAYRLTDWTVRWEAPLPETGFLPGLFSWQGVLLVTTHGGISSETLALDPRTGRKLWDRSDKQSGTPAGGRILVNDLAWEDVADPSRLPPFQLTALDPATGRPLWTVPVSGGGYATAFDPDSRYLVTYGSAGGELVSYDLATGDQLASAPMPAMDIPAVQVVGSLVLLHDRSRHPSELMAYDARTLSRLWTEPGLDQLRLMQPAACGDLLCLFGEQPPWALEPASGEQVWAADWLPVHRDTSFYRVSELAGAGLTGLLLVQAGAGNWLIDAGTGALVLDLSDWRLAARWPGTAGAGQPPLLFQNSAERTVVGRLAPDLSGVRALGMIEVTPPRDCGAGSGFVYCAAGNGSDPALELTVWRHRLP